MPAVHPFVLERPRSVAEVVAILAENREEARIMAGGQSLTPLLTLGFSSPGIVISLDRCDELDRLENNGGRLNIGAMVTTARLEGSSAAAKSFPLLCHAAAQVGSPHVRNFGTAVGNVCHADPGSDLIPALLCYETAINLQSANGQRSAALDQFITGPFTTNIDESEMAVAIDVGDGYGEGWTFGYRKLVKRAGDLAIATCAVRARITDDRIAEARIAIGGPLSVAQRLLTVEQTMIGASVDEATERALNSDLGPDTSEFLMPDANAPSDYLDLMLPRFLAATVGDAVTDSAIDGPTNG